MERYLDRFAPQGYAILRIVAGFLFACHGVQKIFGVLPRAGRDPRQAVELLSRAGMGGLIELVGGALLLVGFMAGWTAFICSGEMAFAYFLGHASRAPLPVQNGGELAVLYCFLFLYMAARGAGIWSIDALLAKPKSGQEAT